MKSSWFADDNAMYGYWRRHDQVSVFSPSKYVDGKAMTSLAHFWAQLGGKVYWSTIEPFPDYLRSWLEENL